LKNQQQPPILARFPDTLSCLTNQMEVEVTPGSGYNTGTFFVGLDRVSLKEGEEMKLKLILILVALAALIASPGMGSRTWSGEVLDIRTGLPISDVSVKAGCLGRVDPFPGYEKVTGPDGKFSITWPVDTWDLLKGGEIDHYLRVDAARTWGTEGSTSGYLAATVIRESPEEVAIYLVPRAAFIRGRAISASDGAPLRDLKLSLQYPGRVMESVTTDEYGEFAFKPITGFRSDGALWPFRIFDIYPPGLTDDEPLDPGELNSPAIKVGDPKYHDMLPPIGDDGHYIRTIDLITSTTDEIHTYVLLKVSERDQLAPDGAITSEIKGLKLADDLRGDEGTDNNATEFVQWAAHATASSEYSSSDWSALQASGEPDTYPDHGDIETAWATLEEDDGIQWLDLDYEVPVWISRVEIYETYNPGAIAGIEIYDQDGGRHLAWEGSMEPARTARISTIDIDADFPSDRIRIILDTRRVSGWNEIDAVALIGSRSLPQSELWSYGAVLIDAPHGGWEGVIPGEAI
jgi:hypothetical protein